MGAFVEVKEQWLRKYIDLENTVPSHDTIERVFEHIDSKAYNKSFMEWTNKISEHLQGRIVAIDRKTKQIPIVNT
ncbi:MAG: transposase family protein [Eubacteriaceae bacterium]